MPWLSWIVSNLVLALLLASAAWIMQRWLRQYAVAHVLWVLVLVKLVTPPLVSVPLQEARIKTACENGTCACGPHPLPFMESTLPMLLFGVWTVGAVATGWLAWRRWTRFQQLTSNAAPAHPTWQALGSRLSTELALRRTPAILVVPGRLPPLVVSGRRRPRVLLPGELIEGLSQPQQSALLLHELIHIKRCDHLVRLLESAVAVVYWWLPVVRWIGPRLRACEENCCDAAVVAFRPNERRDYAQLLLDVLDFVAPAPRVVEQATAMNSSGDLERRLLAILRPDPGSSRTWRSVGVAAVVFACGVVPCEINYDWSRRPPPPAATPMETKPINASPWMRVDHVNENSFKFNGCCPS
jgi:beta-lactamase regulating signal transducer with metallopeptidase domain